MLGSFGGMSIMMANWQLFFFPRSMIRVFPCLVTVDGRWVESFWPFKGSQATISPIFSRPVVLHQVIFWNQCFYLVGGLEHEWIICPFSWEFHHPDEVHHFYIFFRVGLNHQPDRKPYHVPSGNHFFCGIPLWIDDLRCKPPENS